MQTNQRDGFKSRFGAFVAVAGSAVGLGNLWRFPYLVGTNGGGAFILIYLIFIVLLGLPIMFSEFVLGRRTQANAYGAVKKLSNGKGGGWLSIGVLSVIGVLFILSFYSVVGGWTIYYMVNSLSNKFLVADSSWLSAQFTSFTSSSIAPLIGHLLFLLLTALIVLAGIEKGIERYSKILMPILFILVVLLAVRSLTLPGASLGVSFLFKPDFSAINANSILAALGQAFFSLSLGMGCMITYGSYIKREENILSLSVLGAAADTGFAIIAGLAILPAVFAFGISPTEGPGLVFITLPQVFAQLPFGKFISLIFFFILLVASLTSAISLLEVAIATLNEELKWSRKRAIFLTSMLLVITGSLSSLSQGVLADISIFGLNFFDFFDFASANMLLPLCGLLVVLFAGWKMDRADLYDELTSGGGVKVKKGLLDLIYFLIKYVAPIGISVVLIHSLISALI